MGRIALRPALRAYAHAPTVETGVAWSNEKSMAFDGASDYFGTGAGGGLPDGGVSPYSLSFWIKPNAESGSNHFIGSNDPSGNYTRLAVVMNNAARIFVCIDGSNGTGVYGCSPAPLPAMVNGTWYHIVITDLGFLQASPVAINMYLNGSPYATNGTWEGENYTASTSQHFYIGGMNIYGGDYRDCTMDEVGVWRSHVLTPTEVTAIHDQGGTATPGDLENPGGAFTKPDSYWRMGDLDDTDGGSGVIKDRIGSYDMTAGDPGGNGSGAPAVSTSVP